MDKEKRTELHQITSTVMFSDKVKEYCLAMDIDKSSLFRIAIMDYINRNPVG